MAGSREESQTSVAVLLCVPSGVLIGSMCGRSPHTGTLGVEAKSE